MFYFAVICSCFLLRGRDRETNWLQIPALRQNLCLRPAFLLKCLFFVWEVGIIVNFYWRLFRPKPWSLQTGKTWVWILCNLFISKKEWVRDFLFSLPNKKLVSFFPSNFTYSEARLIVCFVVGKRKKSVAPEYSCQNLFYNILNSY